MYAVEKWIVERNRPTTVLAVYTGDPTHTISLTAFAPSPTLSPHDAQAQWDSAIQILRRDGARPKQTPHGVLMATSLAHFRSDYTIVRIPDGNFLAVREHLYANINLLRMGCSGRSALTLEEPSDPTKDRFISTYYLPENTFSTVTSTDYLPLPPALTKSRSHSTSNSHHGSVLNFHPSPSKHDSTPPASVSRIKQNSKPPTIPFPYHDSPPRGKTVAKTKDRALFTATVLELVKLIQAGLSIFGMYGTPSISSRHIDGLLCDNTVEGIRKWILLVGEPCVRLEPMERIADPMFVSAMLSLVLAIRNKLSAIGFAHVVPKDPFLQPHIFTYALATYVHSTSTGGPSASPPSTYHYPATVATSSHSHTHSTASTPGHSSLGHGLGFGMGYTFPPQSSHQQPLPSTVLTRDLLDAVTAAYESKARTTEGRGGVRRALREKLEDFARVGAAAGAAGDSDGDGDGGSARRGATGAGEGSGLGPGSASGTGGVGGGVGLASSGGQLLSGIGSLASGLGLGGGSGSATTGGGAVWEGTTDLLKFVRVVVGKEARGKGKGKERRGDGGDPIGIGYGYGKDKEKDAGIAVSVRGLWSGGITTVVRLRQWEVEREVGGVFGESKKDRLGERERGKDRWALSDGDVDEPRRHEKSDGRSTEEESDIVGGAVGLMWGERVQKKLESWTGITRKRGHMSLDLSSPTVLRNREGGNEKSPLEQPLLTAHQSRVAPSSPTLPPMVFVGGAEVDVDDDDLLSSGQVSPIENQRPFNVLHDGQSESTSLHTINTEYERKVIEFNQKRPWGNRVPQSRISSWADPVSARDILPGEEGKLGPSLKRRSKGRSRLAEGSALGSEVAETEEPDEEGVISESVGERSEGGGEPLKRRAVRYGPLRRRSFHDMMSLRNMHVTAIERMRVDVELCGQLLIMIRREQHLQNVVNCLRILTDSLTEKNTLLREDYQAHLPFLSDLEARTKVMSDIDAETARADKTSQATHTLRYESEQFRVPDLWHTATPPRQKVLALREKVFGTGGRRLPPGVHGAHGRFNRLQWTLDGRERLVDYLGRTESEAEEESLVDSETVLNFPLEGEEEDVVEHPGIKPMWLLRFFTSWGARSATTAPSGEDEAKKTVEANKTVEKDSETSRQQSPAGNNEGASSLQ
ncbi:hypothetical protein BDZ94DRAFT_1194337 [Collybia nuda]|uniref:STB6-like N-terminal domain-containing protein n=1 Tax=Collybia nuda TaxID=64659 RepID=A0A9P6CJC0_9AGAR|nr:hypothetical protein BDZ94DRAFT_1194337 [Collybia nuda]